MQPAYAISVHNLCKTYRVSEREAGVLAALKSLVRPKIREVAAVRDLSFNIEPGEIVGFIGPNGAGKTTTLKMLSGLLHPTSGVIEVIGFNPAERANDYLRQMTLIMGQRNQLVWDIPVIDSFEINRAIYRIPDDEYRKTCAEFESLLELGPLLKKPSRTLSLGERMKCELAASLLHKPGVLFLDEPSIGLDVTMQRRIREFIAEYNRRYRAVVILTSHYMADVEALCKRVVVIHHGRLLFDGALARLMDSFSMQKTVEVRFPGDVPDLSAYGRVTASSKGVARLSADRRETAAMVSRLLNDFEIHDLTVEDPPVEEVIDRVFSEGRAP